MAAAWEDLDQQPQAQPPAQRKQTGAGLNPNASSFSFNPSASTFTPNFAPKAQPAAAAAQPAPEPTATTTGQPPAPRQADHSATNGINDHTQTAEPMRVDPPSEREDPVASASSPAEDADQDMEEANGQVSAGTVLVDTQLAVISVILLLCPMRQMLQRQVRTL